MKRPNAKAILKLPQGFVRQINEIFNNGVPGDSRISFVCKFYHWELLKIDKKKKENRMEDY